MDAPILRVAGLKKYFEIQPQSRQKKVIAKAVDGVSLQIGKGKTLGLVGESGCGKTMTGKMIMKLVEPTAGKIYLNRRNIVNMSQSAFRKYRKHVQMVFQHADAALDPKMSIETILAEPLLLHKIAEYSNLQEQIYRLLDMVALGSEVSKALPHELSNGQKQRIAIAKAISTNPRIIVCDEPVSALDVSVQAEILNLLMDLKRRMGIAYLFISHSLSVVQHVSDDVGVMYLGKIVEQGTTEDIFDNPLHPYTKALLASSPVTDPSLRGRRIELKGEIPSCTEVPAGCPFHTRCPEASQACRVSQPDLKAVSSTHVVSCHLV